MKKSKRGINIGLVLVLTVSLFLMAGIPAAQASIDNQVAATFTTGYWHETNAASVPNVLLPGSFKDTSSQIINSPDSTGNTVAVPLVTYGPAAGLNVGFVSPINLVSGTPPYAWQPPDIAENGVDLNFASGIVDGPFDFTPGFSFERYFSQTEFTGPGTQVVTVSATPAEVMDSLRLAVLITNDYMINANIISASGDGNPIILPGGKIASALIFSPTVGVPYTIDVSISISPDPAVTTAIYQPMVNVGAAHVYASGNEQTGVLNNTTELGTWTIATPDSYSWNWTNQQSYGVQSPQINQVYGINQVGITAGTNYDYRPIGDSVPNTTATASPWIYSNLLNWDDDTDASLISPVLNLSSTKPVTFVSPEDYLVPGSTYTWTPPDIIENTFFINGASIAEPMLFTTGLSVTRNIDQTIFPPEGGTQTLTLNVIPEETMGRLDIHGNADFGVFQGIATITSASGPNTFIVPGGLGFHARIDNPVVGVPYQWQVTIQINPLPVGVAALEYNPNVSAQNVNIINNGIVTGGSLSNTVWNLNASEPLAQYTWQAAGAYQFNWEEIVTRQVIWDGSGRYIYPSPAQEDINQAIEDAMAWVRSQQDPTTGAWYWGRPARPPYQLEEPEAPNVGMTGFAVLSLLHGLVPQTDPQVQAGIQYILSQQDLNPTSIEYGSFGQRGKVYETGLAILALRATNNPIYLDEIALGAQYLINAQNDEDKNYPIPFTINDWAYGGWDYSFFSVHTDIWTPSGPVTVDPFVRSDMSNSQFAIIGLKAAQEAGIEIDPTVWQAAEVFINRCHNVDGGFGYQPASEGGSSSGTITAGAVWCLRLMDVPAGDPLIQSGLGWLDNHPFDGTAPAYAYRNWFLWSAAKAFTLSGRAPTLDTGNWYSDYSRYLIDNQEADGSWLNPDWPEGESNLNATTCGLLVLEKAVLPPPPGIDSVTVERMRVEFDTRPDRDKIKILEAHFQLDPEADYDLTADDVTVNIDGVSVTIPAGSFDQKGKKERYQYNSGGGLEPKIKMELDFDRGEWSLMVDDIDASDIDNSDGVDVTLMIGYMLAGQNVPMWVDRLIYPPHP